MVVEALIDELHEQFPEMEFKPLRCNSPTHLYFMMVRGASSWIGRFIVEADGSTYICPNWSDIRWRGPVESRRSFYRFQLADPNSVDNIVKRLLMLYRKRRS